MLEKQSVSKPESIPEVKEDKPTAVVTETTEEDPEKVAVEANEKVRFTEAFYPHHD